jgi:hypothetical protein
MDIRPAAATLRDVAVNEWRLGGYVRSMLRKPTCRQIWCLFPCAGSESFAKLPELHSASPSALACSQPAETRPHN